MREGIITMRVKTKSMERTGHDVVNEKERSKKMKSNLAGLAVTCVTRKGSIRGKKSLFGIVFERSNRGTLLQDCGN